MTAYNLIGEEVRGFQVIVARPEKKTNLRYPVIDGKRALQLMELMAQRGRQTIVVTSSQYCEETLELSDMREIFASYPKISDPNAAKPKPKHLATMPRIEIALDQ